MLTSTMKAFLVAVILSLCIVYCESCTCNPKYAGKPKALYCLADYGIKARVLSSGEIRPGPFGSQRRYYRIKILSNGKFLKLKSKFDEDKIDKEWVNTATNSAACGILLLKKTYLLAGSIFQHPTPRPNPGSFAPPPKKDELMINLCQVFSPWKDIKNEVIPGFNVKFVRKTYKTRCGIILAPTDVAIPG